MGVSPTNVRAWVSPSCSSSTSLQAARCRYYELPAGLFGQLADKLFLEKAMERDLRHSTENFKALVEAKAPVLA